MELSETQRRAVETVGRNVCVAAGAGSGKTHVLVERFVHLVLRHKISPARILAITFTEKAANEMKRRIVRRLREENLEAARREVENAAIGTIHSFAARILREHPVEAGVDPHFSILEAEESSLLRERVFNERIEKSAADPEVFALLRDYGENEIREGILTGYARTRNTERPFEEILRQRAPAPMRRANRTVPDDPAADRRLTNRRRDCKTATKLEVSLPAAPGNRDFFEEELEKGFRAISDVKGAAEAEAMVQRGLSPKGDGPLLDRLLLEARKLLRAAGPKKEEIHHVKETLLDFAGFLREERSLPAREVFIRLALQFEADYERAKQDERVLDFDDLQLLAVRLLGSETAGSRAVRKIYREKFSEILVDEFQDTNRLQDRLLELVRRENNLFVVGDFKQSIYGFRGAKAEIFLEKEKAFGEDPQGERIVLADNYRSRPKLIEFVNSFFEALWREDAFPFEPLVATRPEVGSGPRVFRLALEKKEEETLDQIRIREARSLARHVQKLTDEKRYEFKEIAFLFEAMSDVHFYEQELRRLGLPYFVVSNRGFYHQPEIRDLLSFLTALENPRREIPLASLLRSPLFQISDETLYWLVQSVREGRERKNLFEAVEGYEKIPQFTGGEREKLRFFLETFRSFLLEKEKLRISEVIEKVLRLTGYDLYVLRLRQGERRYANLKKLVEIARGMEAQEALHLGDFVRAVAGFESREVRESQAQVEAEAGNAVRLLSIHMAKGLEFPVVVLPDLGRGTKSERGPFLISEEGGFGMKWFNEATLEPEETLTFRKNKEREERFRSEESKRLFYVAMTRAREELVLAGPLATKRPVSLPPSSPGASAPGPVTGKKPKDSFHEISTWAEWVEKVLAEGNFEVTPLSETAPATFPFEKGKPLAERKGIRRKLETLSPFRVREVPAAVPHFFEQTVQPEKAYFPRIDLPVSAFLLFAKDPEAYFNLYEIGALEAGKGTVPEGGLSPFPEVKEEEESSDWEELTAAEFGTRVHQILERLLLSRPHPKELPSWIERFTEGLLEKERIEMSEMVRRFLDGREGKEILSARAFYPELPFVLRLPHGLVQGTMDLVVQSRSGEWTILDYKTSRVDESSFHERGESYRAQLELYAVALWQILGTAPREGKISFLRPGLVHTISFEKGDFKALLGKYTEMQLAILEFRKEKLRGIFPGKS